MATQQPSFNLSGASPEQYDDFISAYKSGIDGQNKIGWAGVGVNLATGVLNGILGYKNYRLAKKDLRQQRQAMNINLAQQTDTHNQYKVQKAYQTGKYGSIEEARLATHDQGMLLDTRQLGDSRDPIAQREAQIARDREYVANQQQQTAAQSQAPGILDSPGAVPNPEELKKRTV